MLLITPVQWYFTSLLRTTGESVKLRTRVSRITAEELVDPRSEVFVHTASGMEVVSPYGAIPLADVPLLKTVLRRRFENEVKKVARGQDHRRSIFVFC